jgi:hypothetical protein
MSIPETDRFGTTRILRVRPAGMGVFEVRDDDGALLGTSPDEVKAIWSAVISADLMSERGYRVRVLSKRGEDFLEEYVSEPSGYAAKSGL